MDAEGSLEVIAEIAIAFTGFAGIVGALARERLKPTQPGVWLGFWVMIESSLGVLLIALFPILLHYLGVPDRLVWPASSAFLAVLLVCHFAFMGPQFLRAYRNPALVRLPPLEHPLRAAVLLALVSQVLNTFGFGLPQSVGGFLLGLYLLVLVMALNFAYLMWVLVGPENGSRTT